MAPLCVKVPALMQMLSFLLSLYSLFYSDGGMAQTTCSSRRMSGSTQVAGARQLLRLVSTPTLIPG